MSNLPNLAGNLKYSRSTRTVCTGYGTGRFSCSYRQVYAYEELLLLGYNHEACNHSQGHFGPTNEIEGFWSILKRHLRKLYGCIPTKHLELISTNGWLGRTSQAGSPRRKTTLRATPGIKLLRRINGILTSKRCATYLYFLTHSRIEGVKVRS